MSRIILGVFLMLMCSCATSASSPAPPQPSLPASDGSRIEAAHEELLAALQAQHAQSHSTAWNMAIDHMFAWPDAIKEQVADFIVRPGAAQEIYDDLADHPDGDRALSNLQMSFVMCLLLNAREFQQVDSARFRNAYRTGKFRPLIEAYARQDIQFFFDALNDCLNAAAVSTKP